MTTEKKITKKEMYGIIAKFVEGEALPADVTKEDVVAFCVKEVDALERKAAKAKETAAKKKAEKDVLTELAAEALSDEFEVVADITKRIDFADATPQKVVYRLNKLAEAGAVEKGELSVGAEGEKKRTLVAFRRLQA